MYRVDSVPPPPPHQTSTDSLSPCKNSSSPFQRPSAEISKLHSDNSVTYLYTSVNTGLFLPLKTVFVHSLLFFGLEGFDLLHELGEGAGLHLQLRLPRLKLQPQSSFSVSALKKGPSVNFLQLGRGTFLYMGPDQDRSNQTLLDLALNSTVFRIRDILVRIRIRGSAPLTNGLICFLLFEGTFTIYIIFQR